jgi:valyl-tRNA synthetase
MNLEGLEMEGGIDLDLLTLEDKWMLSRLNRIIEEVNASLREYSFDKAALSAYDFFWKEFCAYYLEITKPVLFGKQGTPADRSNKQKILLVVLCNAVRLLHPMAPFITEELFQLLKKQFAFSETKDPYTQETLQALQSPACIVAPYPKVIRQIDIDSDIEAEFTSVDQLVHAIRNIRAEMQIPPGTPTALHLVGPQKRLHFAEKHQGILKSLVRLESLSFAEKEAPLPFASSTTIEDLRLIIPLPSEMREKEKARLLKEREKLIELQNGARIKLGNQEFVQKAPPQLVEKLQHNLQQAEKDLFEIAQKLEKL